MRLRTIFLVLALCCAPALLAQSVTIGNHFNPAKYGWPPDDDGTLVDLAHPATADGTIREVGFALGVWGGCESTPVEIKFFRRAGNMLIVIGETGPLPYVSDVAGIPLSSPIEVRAGDLIGIRKLPICCDLDCLPVQLILTPGGGEYLLFRGDITTSVNVAAGTTGPGALAVWGADTSGETNVGDAVRTLPVVGSTAGAHGSQWKTSVQLLNPYADATTGRLVFRRAGVPGSWSDPELAYSLAAGETRTFADLLAAMGESGIGSIDVVTDTADTARPPIVVAHIYSVRGDGGTLGLMEEAFDLNDMSYQCSASTGKMIGTRVLRTGVTGFLIAPQWPAQERLNVGVRSLASGATITATVLNAAGSVIHTATRSYAPHLFEQRSAEDFLGFTLTGGESIRITVSTGSAIVYGATTDNTTNDPAIQYVYSLFLPESQ